MATQASSNGLYNTMIDAYQVSVLWKFFPSSLMTRPNKLEGLPLVTLSSRGLEFEARPEQTQLEDLSDASFLGKLLVLPTNVRQDWKVFARCKLSSLFGLVVSNEEKKFFNIDSRWQCLKKFYSICDLPEKQTLLRIFLQLLLYYEGTDRLIKM